MPYFATAAEVYQILGAFLDQLIKEPDMRPRFASAESSFLVSVSDPCSHLLLDCTQDPPRVVTDVAPQTVAEVTLEMSGDDAHLFWMGRLNMPVALATRRVRVHGPLTKVMRLLPALRPAFERYRIYLEVNGYGGAVGA